MTKAVLMTASGYLIVKEAVAKMSVPPAATGVKKGWGTNGGQLLCSLMKDWKDRCVLECRFPHPRSCQIVCSQ